MSNAFLLDVKKLRAQAREKITQGPVTQNYRGDAKTIIGLLDTALATELVCTLRYKANYYMAETLGARVAATEFLEHATQEQEHVDALAKRIVQLGGNPDLCPDTLSKRSHAEYITSDSLAEMIKENLIAERIAIDSYREMIAYIGGDDPTTRRVLEEILAVEEEHADDLVDLMAEYNIS